MDIKPFYDWFATFADSWPVEPYRQWMIDLKREHSRRVAHIARELAMDGNWPEDRQDIAEIAGLLHDLGRFPQAQEFGTFNDRESFNHGHKSAEILDDIPIFQTLAEEDRQAIFLSARHHNAKDYLLEGAEQSADPLVRLVRDADKIDIFDMFLTDPRYCEHASGNVSENILDNALRGRMINQKDIRTDSDNIVYVLCWLYDLNTAAARQKAKEMGIMETLLSRLPEGEDKKRLTRHFLPSDN